MGSNMFRLGQLPSEVVPEFVRCFDIRFGRKPHAVQVPSTPFVHDISIPVHVPKIEQTRARNYFLGFCDCRHAWIADVEKREAFMRESLAASASVLPVVGRAS